MKKTKKKTYTIILLTILTILLLISTVNASEIDNNTTISNINNQSTDTINQSIVNNSNSIDNSINSNENLKDIINSSNTVNTENSNYNKLSNSLQSTNTVNILSANSDIYVNGTSGDDTNDGTSWTNAVKTISKALELISSGYTIHIANGTYTGTNNMNQTISTANIAIVAESKGGVVLDGETVNRAFDINADNVTLDGINFTKGIGNPDKINCGFINIPTNNIIFTLKNCSFYETNTFQGMIWSTPNNVSLIIDNCKFNCEKCTRGAIWLTGGRLNISNTIFYSTDKTIYSGSSIFTQAKINYVTNCTFYNIYAGSVFEAKNCPDGTFNFTHCNFTNNHNTVSGSIYIDPANTTTYVNDCIFDNNTADNKAGAIFASGNLEVYNSNFTDNYAGYYAGAIYTGNLNYHSYLIVDNCTFNHNGAKGYNSGTEGTNPPGAGVIYILGSANITDSNFTDNFISKDLSLNMGSSGAVFYIRQGNNLNITSCNFINNSALNSKTYAAGSIAYGNQGYGGVIAADPGSILTVHNSNFINNSAVKGGAISVRANSTDSALVYLYDCNFTGNKALLDSTDGSDLGGALYVTGNLTAVNVTYINNSISKNDTHIDNLTQGGAIYTGEGSFVNLTTSKFKNNTAEEGGAIYSGMGSKLTDIGSEFIHNKAINGSAIYVHGDIKSSNSMFVNNSASSLGGAIFGNGGGLINTTNVTFKFNNASAGGAIFGAKDSRLYDLNSSFINNTADYAAGIYVNGTIYLNGTYFYLNNASKQAGAVYCDSNGNIHVTRIRVVNNTAGVDGGAIYSFGDLNITESYFTNNSAITGDGGTIFVKNGDSNIESSDFYNSTGKYGGLIYNENGTLHMFIQNTVDNHASHSGGFLYNKNGNVTIKTSNIINNTAKYYGGFAFNENGNLTVFNTTIEGNNATYGGFLYSNGSSAINVFNQSVIVDNNATNGTDMYLNGTNVDLSNFDANWWGVNYPENDQYYWTKWTNRITLEQVINTQSKAVNEIKPKTWISLSNELNITEDKEVTLTSKMVLTDGITILGTFERNRNGEYNITQNGTGTLISSATGNVSMGTNVTLFGSVSNENVTGLTMVDYQVVRDNVYGSVLTGNQTIKVMHDKDFNISGKLTYTNGTPITGATITVKFNSTEFTTSTNSTGEYDLGANLIGGNYTLSIVYPGTSKIWSTNVIGTAEVLPNYPVTVTPENITSHPGDKVTITVNVTYNDGKPVLNGTVNITVNNTAYSAIVSNGKAIFSDVLMPVSGDYNYTANYTGNQYYSNSTNNGTLNITKLNTIVNIPDVVGEPNSKVTVTITVTDEDNVLVDTGNITVTLPNGTKLNFTLVNGKAFVSFTLPGSVGDYTLNATYNGNYRYNTSKNTGNVHVISTPIIKTDVIVTPSNVTSHPGFNVSISVNVTDKNGNPVNSGTISTVINGKTYIANVVDGKAVFRDVIMPSAGVYNYSVNFDGDSYYNPGTGVGVLNITKFNTDLSVSNVTGEPGDNVIVFINLTGENGENLTANVTLTLTNGTKVIIPIVNGKGNYTYTLPGVGNYSLNATYNGDSLYNSSYGVGNVKVTSPFTPKDVNLTPSNITSHPGYTVNITINVTDEDGNPVQNGTVNTTINGVTYTASVINGKATFKNVVMPNEGIYNYIVNYNDGDYYNPSTGTGSLNITKIDVIITPNPDHITGKPGENVTIKINVTDKDGNPINGNVTVNLPNGTNITVPIQNGKGNFTYTLPNKTGNYTINISYNGTNLYNPSNSNLSITVKENTPSPDPKPEPKPDHKGDNPIHNPNNTHDQNLLNHGINSKNNGLSNLGMEKTGNPILILLLALMVLPLIGRKKQN